MRPTGDDPTRCLDRRKRRPPVRRAVGVDIGPVFHIGLGFHIRKLWSYSACRLLEELRHGADSGHADAVTRCARSRLGTSAGRLHTPVLRASVRFIQRPGFLTSIALLGSVPLGSSSGELIDQIRGLEDLKSAITGLQARIAVAFDLAQRQEQAAAGVPKAEQGQGVGAQVALARRESPNRGSRLLGFAKAVVTEMPRTLAALESGQLNEWRATLLVKETACLSVEDRFAVDEELAPDAGTFEGKGDRAIIAAAKAAAYRRDPRSVARRASHAATERTVSLRPAPDTMTYLTALLPVAQGVAAYAALTRAADSARSSGDSRPRGQVMADTLVERVTGTPGGFSGINLDLVMTDRTLFQGDSEPARLKGYGIVPATWARTLLGEASGWGTSGSQSKWFGDRPGRRVRSGPRLQCVAATALHGTRNGRAPEHGLQSPALPHTIKTIHRSPGRYLPHPLLRRAHPTHRPCGPLALGRNHHLEQRRRTLRSLQPHQGKSGLDGENHARRRTHPAHKHSHRA